MRLLTIDFETKDPYIDRKIGSGWTYGVNAKDSDFKVLGAAIRPEGSQSSTYTNDWKAVKKELLAHDGLIMHNAQYDFGCLYYLFYKDAEVMDHLFSMSLYDTEIMSRFYESYHMSHSLDECAKRYLNMKKDNKGLVEAAELHGMLDGVRISHENWVKQNLDLLQHVDWAVVAKYATIDTDITYNLYLYFSTKVDLELASRYSNLSKLLCRQRAKGVRVDLNKAREIQAELQHRYDSCSEEMFGIAGKEFNINSAAQIADVLKEAGVKYPTIPHTKKEKDRLYKKHGRTQEAEAILSAEKPSIKSEWLDTQEHPLCQLICEARKIKKIKGDFIDKVLDIQQWTCPDANDIGKVFPEFNVLRARTGRFSCSGPNLQQIPSDKIYGPLCRSIYLPDEGQKWYSLDYSNQEGRLQVHYAYLLQCEGAALLRQEFKVNPNLDMHQTIADLANIERKQAKVINLGLSYCMGRDKLAASLGLDLQQADLLRQQYDLAMPFLRQLIEKCKASINKYKYIKTAGGRKLALEPTKRREDGEKQSFDYKALNLLIQGSAADQTILALETALSQGLNVLLGVHDELCLSGSYEDAKRLEQIMIDVIPLEVPVVVDWAEGNTWGEAL